MIEEAHFKPKTLHNELKEATSEEIKIFPIITATCLLHKPYIWDHQRMQSAICISYTKSSGLLRDSFVAIFTMLRLNKSETHVPTDQSG
jgi:hypothetical protein